MITAAPVLTFFTTNYMGRGHVATPSTHAVNGGVIREKAEESAGLPSAMRRPAARPGAKCLHNDVARRSSAAFPSGSRGRSLAAKIGVSDAIIASLRRSGRCWLHSLAHWSRLASGRCSFTDRCRSHRLVRPRVLPPPFQVPVTVWRRPARGSEGSPGVPTRGRALRRPLPAWARRPRRTGQQLSW